MGLSTAASPRRSQCRRTRPSRESCCTPRRCFPTKPPAARTRSSARAWPRARDTLACGASRTAMLHKEGETTMRKLKVTTFLTLDGVMQAPGGPDEDRASGFTHGGWSAGYWDDQLDREMSDFMGRPFDMLLGRKTYEIFA